MSPLSNLDAKLRVQTRAELVELQQRLAVTTVYVTHDQVEAMTMGIASRCSARIPAAGRYAVDALTTSPRICSSPVSSDRAMNMLAGVGEWAGADRRRDIGVPDDLGRPARDVGFAETVVIGDGGQVAGRIRIVEDSAPRRCPPRDRSRGRRASDRGEGDAPFGRLAGDNVRVGLRGSVHSSTLRRVRRTTVTV